MNASISNCINTKKELSKECSILIITHNPKVLNYLSPDYVHIMMDGKIVKDGNLELVESIENLGYDTFRN
jgi:Fe-S cluster assembly ATP-binding protein